MCCPQASQWGMLTKPRGVLSHLFLSQKPYSDFLKFNTANWLILSHSGDDHQVVYEGNKVVVEGDPFEITCHITAFDPIKWQRDEQTVIPDTQNKYILEEEKINGKIVAKLSVRRAQHSHSGSYRCTSFYNFSHQVYVLSGKVALWNWSPLWVVLLLFPLDHHSPAVAVCSNLLDSEWFFLWCFSLFGDLFELTWCSISCYIYHPCFLSTVPSSFSKVR